MATEVPVPISALLPPLRVGKGDAVIPIAHTNC